MPAAKKTEEEVKANLLTQNMRYYMRVMDTPAEARKEIGAGRLKGYTDINPMWRIKKLTEIFGPVGVGWWTQNERFSLAESSDTKEIACFCQLELVYVDPETGVASHPITGIGGNKFIAMERNGAYCNDEAYKMAYTDALSIACKSLGFSHDIYYAKDRTKYSIGEDEAAMAAKPAQKQPESKESVAEIQKRIQRGIQLLTKDMSPADKNKFIEEQIVPVIGQGDYRACDDAEKLNELLNKLLESAKKAA